MKFRWLPLGEFRFDNDDVIFKGRITQIEVAGKPRKQAIVGQAMSDHLFNGGSISVDVLFSPDGEEMEAKDKHPNTAEVIVYKNPENGDMVTAGIGGEFYLCSARIWDGKNNRWGETVIKKGWIGHLLPSDVPHTSYVEVQSSQLSMSIDGVLLATASLPFPAVGTQIGLFCQSAAEVRFSNLRVADLLPLAFLVLPL